MALLARLAELCGMSLLIGFFLVVFWKILTGAISLDGILDSPGPNGRASLSPLRAQMLVMTIIVAIKYVTVVLQNPSRDSLPGMPQEWLAALGGSQALFIGGKALRAILSQFRTLKPN